MNIEIFDKTVNKMFMDGKCVFKIQNEDGKDIGMVVSNNDYEEKLANHEYNPVIFLSPLCLRLAYIYGCLNRRYHNPRENIFIFKWRKLKTNVWNNWFVVYPYLESVYGEKTTVYDKNYYISSSGSSSFTSPSLSSSTNKGDIFLSEEKDRSSGLSNEDF